MLWSMRLALLVITQLLVSSSKAEEKPAHRRSGSHELPGASRHLSRLLRSEGVKERATSLHEESPKQAAEESDEDVYVERSKKRGRSSAVDSSGHARNIQADGGESRTKGLSSRKLITHTAKVEDVKTDTEDDGESDNDDDPPQDCEYSDWEAWSECTDSCGGGSKTRTRGVKQEGENGGKECKDSEKKQTEDCNSENCPVDCVISDWQEWSKCTPDCSGKRSRPRTIIQAAKYGGEACGETKEEESCDGVCTDCEFQDWSAWEDCSVTCGGGKQTRTRDVAVPATNGGKACVGNATETKVCEEDVCPVDCVLDDWTAWSSCEPYCLGNMTRQRAIKTPPSDGGAACGAQSEAKSCSNFCLNCRWDDWSAWTPCSKLCAGGKTNRSRDQTLVMPKATTGAGALLEAEQPTEKAAKVYGFELKVNKMCDTAHQDAKGSLSLGDAKEKCQADANCFGLYDAGCDGKEVAFCTSGFLQQPQNASCSYTKKEIGGGTQCEGEGFESKECNTAPCPRDCLYSDWTNWSTCEPFCLGKQSRSRSVKLEAADGGTACSKEDQEEERACMNECTDCRWEEWSEWASCTVSCGGGTQSHRRSIAVPKKGEGRNCTGPSSEEQPCNEGRCPSDCAVSDWTEWTQCEPYCSGSRNRTRSKITAAADGGKPCGPLLETKACGNFCMDCQVTDWTAWTSCSKSCDGGVSNRTRTEVYVQRPNGTGVSLLELSNPAWGYEKKLNLRCDEGSLGADAGKSPAEAEALCSADDDCAALYDEGCNGVLTVCKKGVNFEREVGSCTYSKKEIGKGRPCDGNISQVETCNEEKCPVDCLTSNWTDWTKCEPFCAGTQTRSRSIMVDSAFGGAACGALTQSQECSNICADCKWSNWGAWGACSKSCSGGVQNRSRFIAVAAKGEGVVNCTGDASQTQGCNNDECPLDCQYEDWGRWSTCMPFCKGTRERTRAVKVEPAFGGAACTNLSQKEACSNFCADCVWTNWTQWSDCSTSCGTGSQERSRGIAVELKGRGKNCSGPAKETKMCNQEECPVDCVQSDWKDWSSCEPYCDGVQSRIRKILVEASNGGVACGPSIQSRECNNTCLDCMWSDWLDWGQCDVSCDGGSQSRTRSVAQPKVGEAADCKGASKESQDCNTMSCPVDCQTSDWTKWSTCSPYCLGTQNRSRVVVTPAANGGAACGNLNQAQRCTNFCMDCQLSEWTAWSKCSKSCSGGVQHRLRDEVYVQRRAAFSLVELQEGARSSTGAWGYQKSMGVRCDPAHQRTLDGAGNPQDAEALCSADPSCGGLYDRGCDNWLTICNVNFTLEHEEGSCSYLKQEIGKGDPCEGYISETMTCNEQLCPVNCEMTPWSEWTPCKPYCNGTQTKTRKVNTPAAFGGEECGATTEEQNCKNFCIDCSWTDWSPWGLCSVSCGGGIARRNRTIDEVKQGGGAECSGESEESQQCNEKECPVDCEFSSWADWSSCEPYCKGSQERRREVTREPAFGGKSCMVLAAEGALGDESVGVTRQTRPCSNWCRDCSWLDWTPYSSCSSSCGGGTKSRFRDQLFVLRSKKSGFDSGPGNAVYGYELKMNLKCDAASRREGTMTLQAAREKCNADPECGGVYDEGCDGSVVLCDVGFNLDTEEGSCIRTKLEMGKGTDCEAVDNKETQNCGTASCPIECEYSDWTAWSLCEPFCNGTQTRNRAIITESPDGPCLETTESQECSNLCQDCRWSDWVTWSSCSVSCNGGTQTRKRGKAVEQAGKGKECVGNSTESKACGDLTCPMDCELSDWTAWSPCQPFCSGQQDRSRKILKAARFGGAACGELAEQRVCANVCMDCVLSGWAEWSSCSSSCGGGSRKRLRTESYVKRNKTSSAGLSLLEMASQAVGYEKKMSVKCDEEHQRKVNAKAPLEAQEACNKDAKCGGLYDKGCKNFWAICDTGFILEEEEGSCSYIKKDIGEGDSCEGNIAQEEDCSDQACPVDCDYTEWTPWSSCEPFCSGISNRSRSITKQPQNGGEACGAIAEVNNCSNPCVDCEYYAWGPWDDCSASCGGGSRMRVREIAVQHEGGGRPCPGNATEVESCETEIACPVDCELSDWEAWTPCNPYCLGNQQRSRNIISLPYAGGASCGETSQEANCSNACVDCVVADWSDWSACSATCGGGSNRRSREIIVHAQGEGVLRCPDQLEQTKEDMCAPMDCPVDCQWSDWTPWNGCTATCGEGTQDRTREEAITPESGGAPCEGSNREWKACDLEICPLDCQWGDWSEWGNCSRTCDSGAQLRNRSIVSPKQGEGGDCDGHFEENRPCSQEACPRDCMLHDWQEWSECSASCGPGGRRKRIRDAESEIEGGRPCNESFEDVEVCGLAGCPRNCIWGEWGGWSNCTKSCGKGIAFRERVQLVVAAFGGFCEGSAVQTNFCNDVPCPEDCTWNDWEDWSNCTEPCGSSVVGTKSRLRTKLGPFNAGQECIGADSETAACNAPGGCSVNCSWEAWNEWTACSRSCRTGTRSRYRFVDTEAYGPLGRNCTGAPVQEEPCDTQTPCPIDCDFEDWNDWSSCAVQACGPAQRFRTRENGDPAKNGGAPCAGITNETEDCEIAGAPAPVPCNDTGPDVTIPFSDAKHSKVVPVTDAPSNFSAEVTQKAEIAAVEAAKSAAARGASPEEQAAVAGEAATNAGGNASVAADAALSAAKAAGAPPAQQVLSAAAATASAAAKANSGDAKKASEDAAAAASHIAKETNLSSAEEASYTAAAARDAAVNAATDVSQVAKAALDAAKVAGATQTEQVAAAAVAASDVAKKQGANPEQAAEVAAAAAKAAGASPQEQSAAATMAYNRAGGNETLNASTLGLPPVVGRPNVSEEQAEQIAEKEPESVEGSEVLEVSDPDAFIHDAAAMEAVRDSLAAELGVDPDAIVIEGATRQETSANTPALLEMARKSSSIARRQAPSSGEVNISYRVVPSVSGKTSDEVVQAVEKLDSSSASKLHENVFAEKKLPYRVQVANLEVAVTDKVHGKDQETPKEAGTLKTTAVRSASTVIGFSALVTLQLCVFAFVNS